MKNLLETYRPQVLADLIGNQRAVDTLRAYACRPYSQAFLFLGPTGVGKTSAALALANELDCGPQCVEHLFIGSGTFDKEAAEYIESRLRSAPGFAPWRCIILDECDLSTPWAERLLLSLLERLPDRTTVILSSNNTDFWQDPKRARLLHRLECLDFSGAPSDLALPLQKRLGEIWQHSTGRPADSCPVSASDGLDGITGLTSVRLAVSRLEPFVRDARGDVDTFTLRAPVTQPSLFAPRRESAPAPAPAVEHYSAHIEPARPVPVVKPLPHRDTNAQKAARVREVLKSAGPETSTNDIAKAAGVSWAFADQIRQAYACI